MDDFTSEWTQFTSVLAGGMLYQVFLAPAAQVAVSGKQRAIVCNHDQSIMVLSDEVAPENRQAAITLAIRETEARQRRGFIPCVPKLPALG